MVDTKEDGALWNRLSEVERQSAAQSTDIRGIYAGLDEIRDVLVRIQESAKPNLGGMFLVLLATCTFLVTIGGLTLAPIYRDQARSYDLLSNILATQNNMRSSRFTDKDGQLLMQEVVENRERLATMEGQLQILHGDKR